MVIISCDWGSSSFRLRAWDCLGGGVLSERRSGLGSSALLPPGTPAEARAAFFAARFEEELSAFDPAGVWRDGPVVISGMATSAHGWRELPYAAAPLALDGAGLVTRRERLPGGREVILVSGLSDGQDVMRGEECELLGLAQWPGWAEALPGGRGTVILPGTHCKHVQIEGGRVCRWRTCMTGELYGLLRQHSVLRHSLPAAETGPAAAPAGTGARPDREAVREGARRGRDHGLSTALFEIRAQALLHGLAPADADGWLSGILIAAEFTARPTAEGPLLLSASPRNAWLYETVLDALGLAGRLTVVPADCADRLAAAGHAVLWSRVGGNEGMRE